MSKDYSNVEQVKGIVERSEDEVLEAKKISQITVGKPVKRGVFSRIGHALFGSGEQSIKSASGYVSDNIVKPSLKVLLVDSLVNMVTFMILGSDSQTYTRGTNVNRGGGTAYNKAYRPSGTTRSDKIAKVRTSNAVEDYIIQSHEEALDVISSLTDIASKYNYVSLADYYDMIGARTEYTDNDYGWDFEDMRRVTLSSNGNGWVIKFPPIRGIV